MRCVYYIVFAGISLLLGSGLASASVLPDDRADVLYHHYTGGGVDINGPSILVRKKVGKSTSLVSNYYVDMISSASIDVVTTASPYDEERTQWSLGVDYLRGNTTLRAGYTSSVESDYDAKTYSFSASQDMFGALTTLTLSYAYGDDIVGKSTDPTFERFVERQVYGVGLSQILTRNLIAAVNFETVTDEGYLNNPYRTVRFLNPAVPLGYTYEEELYPNTRTSNAVGTRLRYFLPYRAAIEGEYRFYTDTWDIVGHTASLTYVHPWRDFTFEGKIRYHDQTGAHFFNDLFPRSEATNFRGRDKELSPLTSITYHAKASYEFLNDADGWGFLKKGSVTASFDYLVVDYDEFRDVRHGDPVGEEPFYTLESAIIQVFFSFWY